MVSIGLVVSEEKIFLKVYDVRRTPSDGNSSLFGPGELKINRIRSLAYIKICQPLQFNLILSISTRFDFLHIIGLFKV